MRILAAVGHVFLNFLEAVGRIGLFTALALSHCVRPPYYPSLIRRQLIDIGYYSLPVVGLTAIFTGMVLALQSYTGFARFSAEGAVASIVAVSMTRELGPVLGGLMVAGRIGATAFSITHDLASARKIADRIAMIDGGKIIWSGTVEEIDYSGNAHVDQFINGRAEGPIKMEVDPLMRHEPAGDKEAVV